MLRLGFGSLNLKGSNPEESFLYKKFIPMSDVSWQGVKTFFGVGSLNLKESNPEESLVREVTTYVRRVLARSQGFLRGWIPESQEIQPQRKFLTQSQNLCLISSEP